MHYILITVCERDIATKQFNTFEDARTQMMEELSEEFFKANIYETNVDAWEKIASLDNYNMQLDCYIFGDGCEFEFGKDWAWSNMDDDYDYDWKIVKVCDMQ